MLITGARGNSGKQALDYMYRNLGKWEISIIPDVLRWLRNKPYVDPAKIGITRKFIRRVYYMSGIDQRR